MNNYLIHNAKVCLENEIIISDVLIEDGIVSKIGNKLQCNESIKINADGNYLMPGFIDIHTHLDDVITGCKLADDYESGSKIALLNGITTLYSFITQKKEKTLSQEILESKNKASNKTYANLGWHITPIDFSDEAIEEIISCIKEGFRTIKLYTTYKEAGIYSSYDQILALAEKLKKYDVCFLIHCEDDDTISNKNINDFDLTNAYSHCFVRSEEAEVIAVKRIIEIAKKTESKFHIVHVSSNEALELINQAKKGIMITCETGPHYLTFDENLLLQNSGFKFLCTPPFRSKSNKLKLRESAEIGMIDFFATDHCAFFKTDKTNKTNNIQLIPKGIPGIGALVPIVYNLYKDAADKGILKFVKHLSSEPAKFLNLFPRKGIVRQGCDADLLILNTNGVHRKIKSTLKNVYDPYDNLQTNLSLEYVFLNGELMVKKNEFVYAGQPKGEIL